MKRLLRWLLNLSALISALLFVAVCVLWVRSYRVEDRIEWLRQWEQVRAVSQMGVLQVEWTIFRDGVPSSSRSFDWRAKVTNEPLSWWDAAPTGLAVSAAWIKSGYGFVLIDIRGMPVRQFSTPHWALALPPLLPPLAWSLLYRRRRQRGRRLRRGSCPACGYDLTGNTSGKCSECGEAASSER